MPNRPQSSVPEVKKREEQNPPLSNTPAAGITTRKAWLRMAVAALAITLEGCLPEADQPKHTPDKPASTVEVKDSIPTLQLLPTEDKDGLTTGFTLDLFDSEREEYNFTVIPHANPKETVVVTSIQSDLQSLPGTFIHKTDHFDVIAADVNGGKIDIDRTKKPGTIYGPNSTFIDEGKTEEQQ